ncbi:MAG: RNA-binding cell elongation regulator Jag/EloR [Eubacteriales bacterium]|nr:RNA-binding cell elongation regulator Jag/EloR [Eubacteriales bacterium]
MEEKEYSAKTLSDAITNACEDLLITSDMLDYTIVQESSNGFLGLFGSKPCIIRVKVKSEDKNISGKNDGNRSKGPKENKPVKANKEAADTKEIRENKGSSENKEKPERKDNRQPKNEQKQSGNKNSQNNKQRDKKDVQPIKETKDAPAAKEASKKPEKRPERAEKDNAEKRSERTGTVTGDPNKTAEEFLTNLFASMEMKISYSGEFKTENNELIVDLSGEDMGVLIGKRGQTLDALQYLTSQVVNKHQSAYIRVKLDTENYRERRKETMETLALNIAQKVKRTKKPVALEPMNPYERRIIHSVLQNEKDIITRSEGVEPYRHVVVCPARKKKSNNNNVNE